MEACLINNKNHGFVLVTVLWFLFILTLIIGFFATWVQRELDTAQQLQADTQYQIAYHDTRATLLYLLSTQRFTFAGLTLPGMVVPTITSIDDLDSGTLNLPIGGEIAVDDQAYKGCSGVLFSLQDARGLINPNFASENALMRLLALFGVEAEQRGPLVAKLQDYIDTDDLFRINGAERDEYEEAGLLSPTNRFLRTSMEAKSVLDWANYPQLWQADAWPRLTSTSAFTIPNVNTAPLLILQAYFGLSQETAQLMIEMRRQQPFMDITKLNNFIEFNNPEDVLLFPSSDLRLSLWHPKANYMQQWHISMTPFAHQQTPWQVNFAYNLPLETVYAQYVPNALSQDICNASFSTYSQ